jgi:hypothetical protein
MTPFEETLYRISLNLNSRLTNDYKKINIQGCNKPNNVQLVFTIFDYKNNYSMEFCSIKNFRQYRADGDTTIETDNINKYSKMFESTLSKYVLA